jgi:hypothetical protein
VPDLVKVGQRYQALCVKTYIRFTVAGDRVAASIVGIDI